MSEGEMKRFQAEIARLVAERNRVALTGTAAEQKAAEAALAAACRRVPAALLSSDVGFPGMVGGCALDRGLFPLDEGHRRGGVGDGE